MWEPGVWRDSKVTYLSSVAAGTKSQSVPPWPWGGEGGGWEGSEGGRGVRVGGG